MKQYVVTELQLNQLMTADFNFSDLLDIREMEISEGSKFFTKQELKTAIRASSGIFNIDELVDNIFRK